MISLLKQLQPKLSLTVFGTWNFSAVLGSDRLGCQHDMARPQQHFGLKPAEELCAVQYQAAGAPAHFLDPPRLFERGQLRGRHVDQGGAAGLDLSLGFQSHLQVTYHGQQLGFIFVQHLRGFLGQLEIYILSMP